MILKIVKKLCILFVLFYKFVISPFLPRSCLFKITCSTFAINVLKKYTILKAIKLIVFRLLICNNCNRLNKIIRRNKYKIK